MSAKVDPSASSIEEKLLWAVDELAIELPSWAFLNTGTRFKVWQQPGTPRNVEERIDERERGAHRMLDVHYVGPDPQQPADPGLRMHGQ